MPQLKDASQRLEAASAAGAGKEEGCRVLRPGQIPGNTLQLAMAAGQLVPQLVGVLLFHLHPFPRTLDHTLQLHLIDAAASRIHDPPSRV